MRNTKILGIASGLVLFFTSMGSGVGNPTPQPLLGNDKENNSSNQQEVSSSENDSGFYPEGRPINTASGGTRGCPVTVNINNNLPEKVMVLVPQKLVTRTASAYPTFFVYLPQDVSSVELVLENKTTQTEIYRQEYALIQKPGIVELKVSADKMSAPLEVGNTYNWHLDFVCNNGKKVSALKGAIERVNINTSEANYDYYRKTGIWIEAFNDVVEGLKRNPQDPLYNQRWRSLLNTENVGLASFVDAPLVDCCMAP